ncbi:MAG: SMP-30/gluconolactonase/LRE family protein [Planctomycetota bacterium]|nr:SMP-30/gluconolactonase/LRE family protein [Planctomycetota bacterium]
MHLRLILILALTPALVFGQFGSSDYYVSAPYAGGIWKGDSQTGETTPFALGLLIPHYGWFGNDGNFYVPDRGWNALMKITPQGQIIPVSAGGHFMKPVTCIPTLDDTAWVVSDMEANKIIRVEYDGTQTLLYDNLTASGLLNGPDGIAYDDAGNLYVANLGNDTLIKIDPQGQATLFSDADIIREPGGVAIDGAGNLFVANYGSHVISRFRLDTGEGQEFTSFDSTKMANPNDLKLSRKGGLLVSGRQGRVSRIDALGQVSIMFENLSLSELDGVSVPEDATLCTGRFTTYGRGEEGSGGIIPQLRAIFSPCPGQVIGLEILDFLGGTQALMFVSSHALPSGLMAFKGAPLLVDPSGVLFLGIPLVLPGSGTGEGDLTLQFQIPDLPGLAGLELFHQVFALDPSAAGGISASNGLKETFGL